MQPESSSRRTQNPPVLRMIHLHPVHFHQYYYLRIYFNIISQYQHRPCKRPIHFSFISFLPIRATFLAHLILLDFIVRMIFVQYRSYTVASRLCTLTAIHYVTFYKRQLTVSAQCTQLTCHSTGLSVMWQTRRANPCVP